MDQPLTSARAQARDRIIIDNARIVLRDTVFDGSVTVENGAIVAIGPVGAEADGTETTRMDFQGDYLLPGLIDIHTDHFEKHVYPRAHVRWDYMRAALAHDAQVIGGGVTTVFDSLAVGATSDNPERAEILAPMIDALERSQAGGMLRAEHFVHLRCEITAPETPDLMRATIESPLVKVVSVMEHLPGVRQSRDLTHYIQRNQVRTGATEEVIRAQIDAVIAEKSEIGAVVRPQVVEIAKAHGMPLLSHDDTDIAHVDEAAAEGITVSEFPCTLEAAREARLRGMLNVAGAPNILRGGSQSGNVAVRDLLNEDLVDILASDYVPRSLLDAAFMIAADKDLAYDLPGAVAMVTANPAKAVGLDDRGAIEIGKRADLLRVALHDGHPYLKQVWRAGHRVA